MILYFTIISTIWIPCFGGISVSLNEFLIILLETIIIVIEYSVFFTFILLLFKEAMVSMMASLVLAFVMFLASATLIQGATTREFYYSVTYGEEGIIDKTILGRNSSFPGEEKIKLYKNILYSMPAGQATLIGTKLTPGEDIENRKDYDNKILIMYSVGNIIIFSALGIILFNKKELK